MYCCVAVLRWKPEPSLRLNPNHVGCPMERFFSQENIERYRKLFDMSTTEPQRRLILNLLALHAHTMQMAACSELTVRVERRGGKYTWQLHRDGHFQPVKFSAPVYLSEKAARASGNEVRTLYLARLAARRPQVKRPHICAASAVTATTDPASAAQPSPQTPPNLPKSVT